MSASAPGKVMLAGEYAILEGGCALVAAVDRRAFAHAREPSATVPSGVAPLPPEAVRTLAHARRTGLLTRDWTAEIDATRLAEGGRKLGIGSSAAVAVAALASALVQEGFDPTDAPTRVKIASMARAGHREVQGGGSGVDVLASTHGGVLRVVFPEGLAGEAEVVAVPLPTGLHWAVLWTGTPARTSELLRATRDLSARDRATFARCMDAIREAETRFFTSLLGDDAREAVRAVQAHATAMDTLGRAAGAPIVTDAMRQLGALAEPLGAAMKPSGAGGGDIVLAVAQDAPTLSAIVDQGAQLGFARIPLRIDHEGARAEGVR